MAITGGASDGHDLRALLDQRFRDVAADEPGRPGDEIFTHGWDPDDKVGQAHHRGLQVNNPFYRTRTRGQRSIPYPTVSARPLGLTCLLCSLCLECGSQNADQ